MKNIYWTLILVFACGNFMSCKKDSTPNSPNPPVNSDSTTYYINASNGSDSNAGTSPNQAWETLDKVSRSLYKPGDKVLFKSGQTFKGKLNITSSGNSDEPLIFGTYGGEDRAKFDGEGKVDATIFSKNQQYIELQNLDVTNYLNGNDPKSGKKFFGIHIVNQDFGTLSHIYLKNCRVHDVNSESDSFTSRYYGGVLIEVTGDITKSNYDDILIENCVFENLSRTGFNFKSSWSYRNSDTSFGMPLGDGRMDNWYPSKNIIIKNNEFKNIVGNGLIVRVSDGTRVEHNIFDKCGNGISGNAMFCFNTDHTIFQYNEAKNTVYNAGDTDAAGIDSDYRTKNTLIQYNYLHDNGQAGIVVTGGPADGKAPEKFNTNTIIRYNVLENNKRRGLYFSGNAYDAYAYNNVIYNQTGSDKVEIVKFGNWKVWPHDVHFFNNIFNVLQTGATYTYGNSNGITFSHNVYYGAQADHSPTTENSENLSGVTKDGDAVLADPLLLNPGAGDDGYKLSSGSPAIGAGTDNGDVDQPSKDYYDNMISTPLNIGVYQ